MMPEMVERSIEPPEDKVFCECDRCGGEIYVGEEYYDFDGDIICERCEPKYIREHFRRVAE